MRTKKHDRAGNTAKIEQPNDPGVATGPTDEGRRSPGRRWPDADRAFPRTAPVGRGDESRRLFSAGYHVPSVAVLGTRRRGRKAGHSETTSKPTVLTEGGWRVAADVSTGGEGAFISPGNKPVQMCARHAAAPGPEALGFFGQSSARVYQRFRRRPPSRSLQKTRPFPVGGQWLRPALSYSGKPARGYPGESRPASPRRRRGTFQGAFVHVTSNNKGGGPGFRIVPSSKGLHVLGPDLPWGRAGGCSRKTSGAHHRRGHAGRWLGPLAGERSDFAENEPWNKTTSARRIRRPRCGDPVIGLWRVHSHSASSLRERPVEKRPSTGQRSARSPTRETQPRRRLRSDCAGR